MKNTKAMQKLDNLGDKMELPPDLSDFENYEYQLKQIIMFYFGKKVSETVFYCTDQKLFIGYFSYYAFLNKQSNGVDKIRIKISSPFYIQPGLPIKPVIERLKKEDDNLNNTRLEFDCTLV